MYVYISPDEYYLAKENGIKATTLERRLRTLGWDKQRAITTPPQKQTDLSKWREIAKKNGINKGALRKRIMVYGWDTERAVTEPIHNTLKN